MKQRKTLTVVCLAVMGLGIAGEGVALAKFPPTQPPGRFNEMGRDELKRSERACFPTIGPPILPGETTPLDDGGPLPEILRRRPDADSGEVCPFDTGDFEVCPIENPPPECEF